MFWHLFSQHSVVWKADYPKVVFTKLGEDVTIPCNVTYPPSQSKEPIQAYWKRWGNTKLKINDNDKNEFLYHPNNTFVIKSFQTRTNLTGNITQGNCSLKINIIQHGDIGHSYYLRIATGADNFSFNKDLVSIQISGTSGTISTIPKDMSNTVDSTTTVPLATTKYAPSTATYIATTVPVVAVLLVAVLGIVWFFKYRKRVKTTKKKDDTQVSPPKVIDEPVYGNVQGPDDPMDSMDQMDSVYANVDHAKQ
nr:uncharacterized protein LOC115101699 isoform X2 [Oncorhynchus nerka]